MWKVKFIAKATKDGYCNLLLGKETKPEPVAGVNKDDEETIDNTLVREFEELNDIAFSTLTIATSGPAFNIVKRLMNNEGVGDACAVWEKMHEHYEPNTQVNLINLHHEFT